MRLKELLDEEDRHALEMLNNRPHGSVHRRGQSMLRQHDLWLVWRDKEFKDFGS